MDEWFILQDVPGLWNLDILDGRNDKQYEYGRSMGSGVRIYVLDTVRFLWDVCCSA